MGQYDILVEKLSKKYSKSLPYPANSLNAELFYFPIEGGDPIMQLSVERQIFSDIETFNAVNVLQNCRVVDNYCVVGECLKMDIKPGATVDVYIKLAPEYASPNTDNLTKERILNVAKTLSGNYLPGTQSKVQYHIGTEDISKKFPAIYQPYMRRWIKKPKFLDRVK